MRDISGIDPSSFSKTMNWSSWDRDTRAANVLICTPRDIDDLVAAMWLYRDRPTRPIGSSWSLSAVTRPMDVAIDLADMVRDDDEFGTSAARFLEADQTGTFFVIKGGARLYQINEALWARGYSFPTLGGSHGQTLAGAMSTSTHGGDFDYSSVCDAVRALHVVMPGGKEFWLEPTSGGVTDHAKLASNDYPDWHADIEIVQDDDLFGSMLVSCGRLGIIHAALVEVEDAFYQEHQTLWESWKPEPGYQPVELALRSVVATRSWSGELFSGAAPHDSNVEAPSFLEIHYDPKGNASYVRHRWRTRRGQPELPRPSSPSPASDSHDLGLAQFGTNIPSPAIIPNIFAAEHRKNYSKRLTDQTFQRRSVFKDRNYRINVGVLDDDKTWKEAYEEFWQHGPFVESMEFFFDAFSTEYIDFINDVHDQDWGTICAGYIALRYTRTRTTALLGTSRFAQTVAVECTILQGFKDAAATQQKIASRARDAGAVAHWGQENPHSAPAIDRMFGADVRRWRRAIPRLLGAYADIPSNIFTRQKGLEYGPALRIGIGSRTMFWLGYNEIRTSTLFHRGFVGPAPTRSAFRFVRRTPSSREVVVVVQADGQIQAGRWVRLPVPAASASIPPGSLTIRREGVLMGVIEPTGTTRGNLHFERQDELPRWVTR